MLTRDGDDIARLVGGLLRCDDRRVADSQFRFGIDDVRDGLLVHKLVHVSHADQSAQGVGRKLDLQLVTGLADKLGRSDVAAEYDLLNDVEVLTLDGDDIPGKSLARSE